MSRLFADPLPARLEWRDGELSSLRVADRRFVIVEVMRRWRVEGEWWKGASEERLGRALRPAKPGEAAQRSVRARAGGSSAKPSDEWSSGVARDYLTLRTADGYVLDVYGERRAGTWWLQRVLD